VLDLPKQGIGKVLASRDNGCDFGDASEFLRIDGSSRRLTGSAICVAYPEAI
jgi:hypothetical protein